MTIVTRNMIRRRRMRERLAQQQQAAANAAQQQQAAKAAAEAQAKQAEQQAITNASAITDSGRQTDIVNNTTEAPVANTGQPPIARKAQRTIWKFTLTICETAGVTAGLLYLN